MKKRIILTTRQLLTWGISHFTPLPLGEGTGEGLLLFLLFLTSHTPDSAPT